jgi:hypothetical protein
MHEPYVHWMLAEDGETPVSTTDVMEWAQWFESHTRRTVDAVFVGDVWISTVFLGVDYNHLGVGPPILWETMAFGVKDDGDVNFSDERECRRYSSLEAARLGHEEIVRGLTP